MKTTNPINSFAGAATIALLATDVGQAAVSITIAPNGADIVMTASGSLHLSELTLISGGGDGSPVGYASASIGPSEAWIITGATGVVDMYQLAIGPSSVGTSTSIFDADVAMGDVFGIIGGGGFPGLLLVPFGYISDTPLASTGIFTGATLSSLGLTEGTHVWSWGTGGSSDSLSVTIIPEPTSLSIIAVSLFTCLTIRTRSRTIRA